MKLEIKTIISAKSIYSYGCDNKSNGSKLYKNLLHTVKVYRHDFCNKNKISNRVGISKTPNTMNKKRAKMTLKDVK